MTLVGKIFLDRTHKSLDTKKKTDTLECSSGGIMKSKSKSQNGRSYFQYKLAELASVLK